MAELVATYYNSNQLNQLTHFLNYIIHLKILIAVVESTANYLNKQKPQLKFL